MIPKTQYTKEQLAEFLMQAQERSFQRLHEEFRQEQLEIYRASLKKEAEQVNKTETVPS
jgi:hypothetical protein